MSAVFCKESTHITHATEAAAPPVVVLAHFSLFFKVFVESLFFVFIKALFFLLILLPEIKTKGSCQLIACVGAASPHIGLLTTPADFHNLLYCFLLFILFLVLSLSFGLLSNVIAPYRCLHQQEEQQQ